MQEFELRWVLRTEAQAESLGAVLVMYPHHVATRPRKVVGTKTAAQPCDEGDAGDELDIEAALEKITEEDDAFTSMMIGEQLGVAGDGDADVPTPTASSTPMQELELLAFLQERQSAFEEGCLRVERYCYCCSMCFPNSVCTL